MSPNKFQEHVPTSDMEQDEPDPRSTVKGEEATSSKVLVRK